MNKTKIVNIKQVNIHIHNLLLYCTESKNPNCRRPLTLFSFITATVRDGSQVTKKRLQDVSELMKKSFAKGTTLKCREKNRKY